MLDDVGYGQLSAYGGLVNTPNIDRLATNGLRYANMHTTALCSPTRSCILTGRNHHSNGVAAIMEVATGYPDEALAASANASGPEVVEGEVLWPGLATTLQAIDVPALVGCAERTDVVIELCVRPGEVIPERGRVAVVHGGAEAAADAVLAGLRTGIERTFDQDPAMALRVLADIALRALSPAVNDPTTAVQALDGIDQLLRVLVRRNLAVETVKGSDGQPRLLLRLASWEDYVGIALDEIIAITGSSPLVLRRMQRLLTEPAAIAPAGREQALQARLEQAGEARA